MTKYERADELQGRLPEIAAEVATKLPGEWRSQPQGDTRWYVLLVRADGATIWFGTRVKSDARLVVSGVYPKDNRRGGDYGPYGYRPEISVGATRPPAAIANEITRRFLGDYLATWSAAVAGKQQAEENGRIAEAAARRLARILGDREPKAESDRLNVYIDRGAVRGSFEVQRGSRDDRVEVRLSGLTVEQAEAIARVLVAGKETA
jgi:hypothetical protein